ncbi:MAG: protein kinase [Candidatus Obscuribacter sp.]|nr:protein kinase [Candidatus Obscuribacter sp.]
MWKPAEKLETPKLTEIVAPADDAVGAEQCEGAVTDVAASNASPAAPQQQQQQQQQQHSDREQTAQHQEQHTQAQAQPFTQSLDNPAYKPIDSTDPPQLGERYEVLGLVGSGGMGTVWKVFDKELNETFAIKVLNPDLVADETANKRFQKEAKLASELTHANIAAIFGPGTDTHGRPYIIMRYVDGESLADILKRESKLSEERALDIFKQVCEALSHSHMKGIVHRDIKPSNIIISKTESGGDLVQIVDFGIARYIYEEVTKTQALTKAVDIFGSPMYMSPEQFLGEEITAQSDIYSLGCVLYEMLTGTPPFTDENPVKLVLKQMSEPANLSKVPQSCREIVSRCLHKDKSVRFSSVDYAIQMLSRTKAQSGANNIDINMLLAVLPSFLLLLNLPATSKSIFALAAPLAICLIWAATHMVNRCNALASKYHLRLEFALFLSFIGSCLVTAIGWLVALPLSLMSLPVIILAITFIGIADSLRTLYAKLMQQQNEIKLQYRYNRTKRHLSNFIVLLPILTSLPLFFGFLCTRGVTSSLSLFLFLFTLLVLTILPSSLAIVILASTYQQHGGIIKATKNIASKLILGYAITASIAAIAVFLSQGIGITEMVGRKNFLFDFKHSPELETEALKYPDTEYGLEAKLEAAQKVIERSRNSNALLALANQVIDSKAKKRPEVLSTAYYYKLQAKSWRQQATAKDIDNALDAIEMLPDTVRTTVTIDPLPLEANTPIYQHTLKIADIATEMLDIPRAERAISLAKHWQLKEQYPYGLDWAEDKLSLVKRAIQAGSDQKRAP